MSQFQCVRACVRACVCASAQARNFCRGAILSSLTCDIFSILLCSQLLQVKFPTRTHLSIVVLYCSFVQCCLTGGGGWGGGGRETDRQTERHRETQSEREGGGRGRRRKKEETKCYIFNGLYSRTSGLRGTGVCVASSVICVK